jgi:hypothetical protein
LRLLWRACDRRGAERVGTGSPFGQSIAALVVYLHYAHAIGLERLAWLRRRRSARR